VCGATVCDQFNSYEMSDFMLKKIVKFLNIHYFLSKGNVLLKLRELENFQMFEIVIRIPYKSSMPLLDMKFLNAFSIFEFKCQVLATDSTAGLVVVSSHWVWLHFSWF
jgi:hypothetical protein